MLVIKVHNLKVMRQTLGNDSVNEFLKEMVAFFVSLSTIPVFTSFTERICAGVRPEEEGY